MARRPILAAALAEALNVEISAPRAIAERWTRVLGLDRAPPWLRRLARRTAARMAEAHATGSPLRTSAIAAMLARDHGLERAAGELTVRRWLVAPEAMTPAPGPPSTWSVPSLTTSGDVAAWLGLSVAELRWFAGTEGRAARTPPGKLAHYTCRWRAKASGGHRLIEAPKARTKALQRRVLQAILDRVPVHHAAHGFAKGRSVLTHAALHAGTAVVIVIDLASFFATVRASRVFAIFATLGYPDDVARLLTGLATHAVPAEVMASAPPPTNDAEVRARFAARRLYRAPHLPQGAPTSPALANLAAYRLDARLAAAAESCGARYSRYADDLTFSGGPDLARRAHAFCRMVRAIAEEEGFDINRSKTRVLRASVRQEITGVVVNARPNVRRRDFDRLKAILHNCRRSGPASQNREGVADFRAHLTGRVAWVESINPKRGAALRAMLDAIEWTA